MNIPMGAPAPSDDPVSSMVGPHSVATVVGLDLDIDIEDGRLGAPAVVEELIARAVETALTHGLGASVPVSELYVRIVGADESRQLNKQYRSKDKPTNVLSFPASEPADIKAMCLKPTAGGPPLMLGDIIIAAAVVVEEAAQQGKATHDHLTHLLVHGVLHLLGFDHIDDRDAEIMENMERIVLSSFGIADPYNEEANNA